MRLTLKTNNPFTGKEQYYPNSVCDDKKQTECNNKLGRLEDIEDKLGVDLVTVFKALKNGIYEKEGHSAKESIRFIPNNCLVFDDEFLYELKYCKGYTRLVRHPYPLYLKDYGKTWALTKEELL